MICWSVKNIISGALIFRDVERGNKVSIALSHDITKNEWACKDLTTESVGDWEPTFDTELWATKKRLDLFIQKVAQVDAEGTANSKPTPVQVFTWNPFN